MHKEKRSSNMTFKCERNCRICPSPGALCSSKKIETQKPGPVKKAESETAFEEGAGQNK